MIALTRLLVPASLLLTACATPDPPADPESNSRVSITIGSTTNVLFGDVLVKVNRDVPISLPYQPELTIVSNDGDEFVRSHQDGPEIFLRGRILAVHEGRLFLGGTDFGPVTRNSRIRIEAHGIFVGDFKRGDLPPWPDRG